MRFVAQTPGELHGTITRTACHTRPHCTQCSLKRGDPSVARMVGPASTCRHPTSCMPSREGGEEHETGCMHVAVMHPQNYRRLATCQQRAKQLNTFDPQYVQNSPPREPNSTRKTNTRCKMTKNQLDFAEERCSRGMQDLARGRTTRHRTTHTHAYELRVMLAQTASCYRQNLGPNGPPSYLSVIFSTSFILSAKKE